MGHDIPSYEECICEACDTNNIEGLYHVFVECPKYTEHRKNTIEFVLDCEKSEFYYFMNNLSPLRLKQITQFMSFVEENRKANSRN